MSASIKNLTTLALRLPSDNRRKVDTVRARMISADTSNSSFSSVVGAALAAIASRYQMSITLAGRVN